MNRRGVAVSLSLAVGLGLVCPTASAEGSDEADEELESILQMEESEVTTAPSATESSGAEASTGPSSEPAPTEPEAPLDVIPVPQKEPASTPAPQPKKPKSPIEEIIVTAQRREENAQDVAISLTVFNQEQLTNANVTNASDLAIYTPSLSTNTRFGNESASFAIRGFTQELRTTASVGSYFAEVVAPRGQISQTSGDGAGPGALFDLQNVQVLKGPQGTLFGRNTTGGAVLLVPNKPTDDFEGYVELSGGDFAMRRAQAVVNLPISDGFKLRLGVDGNEREGHLNNVSGIGADDLGNVNYAAYRLSMVLNITDALENYSILSYVDSRTHGYAGRLFACNPDVMSSPLSVLTRQGCQTQLANQAATGQDGYYDLVNGVPTTISTITEKRFINTTTWNASEDLTFKNIFAYAHLHTVNAADIFGTHFPETAVGVGTDPNRQFTIGNSLRNPDFPTTSQTTMVEEIQLQGRSFDQHLTWQAGAYYENSRPDGWSGSNVATLISCDQATVERDPSQYNCFDQLGGAAGGVLIVQVKTEYLNKALYSQATFDILDQLSLTGGIRYTWDKTEGEGMKTRYRYVGTVQQAPTVITQSPESSSGAPTWLLDLNYRPIDGVMTYAKYVRGYRQGSVNVAADPGIDTSKPEKVDTYEIGAKTTFEGLIPGRFNIAAFYNDFTNQQLQVGYLSQNTGPATAIFNAGKSRIAGVEVEAYFELLEDLGMNLSYSYLDTKLLEQEDHRPEVQAAGGVIAGETYTPIADTGDSLPFAPEQAYVASLNYRLPFSEGAGPITLGATYAYTGRQRASASSSSPYAVLDAHAVLNLNLNWSGIFQQPLDLSLFATNVLDEEYATFIGGTYNILGFESRQMGMPRMFGGRLKYNFGARAD